MRLAAALLVFYTEPMRAEGGVIYSVVSSFIFFLAVNTVECYSILHSVFYSILSHGILILQENDLWHIFRKKSTYTVDRSERISYINH